MSNHPDERLDVVDQDNVVIGQADRQEVHNKHLLHRAVHLILTTGEGHFLLQQRANSAPTFPGRWDSSASGHVIAGDSFDQTVQREAKEEIGYNAKDPAPVFLIEGSAETDYEWVQFYTERVEERPSFRADPAELKDLRWWSEEELVEGLVNRPDHFTPVFTILFFLWRKIGFLVPEEQKGGWYSIDVGNAHRLQVRRALLEGAGLKARVEEDQHWLAPHGGRTLFGGRREARNTALCVPRESLPDAIALLYLSRPADEESFAEIPE